MGGVVDETVTGNESNGEAGVAVGAAPSSSAEVPQFEQKRFPGSSGVQH